MAGSQSNQIEPTQAKVEYANSTQNSIPASSCCELILLTTATLYSPISNSIKTKIPFTLLKEEVGCFPSNRPIPFVMAEGENWWTGEFL